MDVSSLQQISLISFIVAAVFLVLSLVLFFVLDIPKIIGDLSGATARKAIESIRQQNEDSGEKAYKPSPINAARGKLTDKISPSGNLLHKTNPLGVAVGTEKLAKNKQQSGENETTILNQSGNETTVLRNNETTVLSSAGNETTVLNQAVTGQLVQPNETPLPSTGNVGTIIVEAELCNLGSTEIIE